MSKNKDRQQQKEKLMLFVKKNKKSVLLLGSLFLVSLLFVVILQVTNALPRSQDRVDVLTQIGNLEVGINDKDTINEVTLGEVATRNLAIENKGDTHMFVRVMVFPTLETNDNLITHLTNQEVIQNLNTSDWKDGGDGYYYYIKKLPAGKTTSKIFSELSVPMTKQKGKLAMNIKVEATTSASHEYRQAFWGNKQQSPNTTTLQEIDDLLNNLKD